MRIINPGQRSRYSLFGNDLASYFHSLNFMSMILNKSTQWAESFHVDFNDHIIKNEDLTTTYIKQIWRLAHLQSLGLAKHTEKMA